MRIITGKARGRRLKMPKGEVRPSTDRLREALFSILSIEVEDARVLDLFAGTGSLGLEALSRGAREAVFVEQDRRVARVTEENIKLCGLNGRVVSCDVEGFVKREMSQFDLVFADPPYAKSPRDTDYAKMLLEHERLPGLLADDGLLVVEVWKDGALPPSGAFDLVDDRKYGVCRILFYRKAGS